MATDHAFWRSLREEFESLQPGEFSLAWTSHPPVSCEGELLLSCWSWWRFPDESMRARLSAIALKGAKALGHDSEDAWFDELRRSSFVKFWRPSGHSGEILPDGTVAVSTVGSIEDVVKESITLCHKLEASAATISMRPVEDSSALPAPEAETPARYVATAIVGPPSKCMMVDAYIEEVEQKTGQRISRTDIWKLARYKSRTEFERWESGWYEKRGRKMNKAANERFTRILAEEPHLKLLSTRVHAFPRIAPR